MARKPVDCPVEKIQCARASSSRKFPEIASIFVERLVNGGFPRLAAERLDRMARESARIGLNAEQIRSLAEVQVAEVAADMLAAGGAR